MSEQIIDAVKFQEALDAMCEDKDARIAELESEAAITKAEIEGYHLNYKDVCIENLELQSHINTLREALHLVNEHSKLWGFKIAENVQIAINEALSATPAESLQAHDDMTIERCAKVCEDAFFSKESPNNIVAKAFAEAIRALKGK